MSKKSEKKRNFIWWLAHFLSESDLNATYGYHWDAFGFGDMNQAQIEEALTDILLEDELELEKAGLMQEKVGWIPVSEGLPPENTEVEITWEHIQNKNKYVREISIGYICKDDWYLQYEDECAWSPRESSSKVLAWRPLRDIYKGE